ncbi:sel1 repeat family protein [Thiorhodococcus mannitoliphagus]|uniref:Sel1 repeat family protein n=1 Tax=Thiorhodococcus mannitoliphagus TaxID=329406 RepID=A0A6P1DXY8_9GAMM|nr:tetratricopeptide repeat protein [Thiorhodococcus mannitoliphagus]NEX21943.1 sel1 repeat family protein [Thiorhodococcus mannitoliphagus]
MARECWSRYFISGLSFILALGVAGCASTSESGDLAGIEPVAPGRGVDDYVLVDCLLPGQIRQLGTRMTYMAPRRMVKSTKSDCGIRGGEFVLFDRSDYGSALQTLLPKAQGGDAVAQTYVGEIYENGLGLSAPDYANAASWYRKAAAQNHSPAQTYLGSLYERGLGVPKDKAKALDLYRQASGLTEDRLIFESELEAQRKAFQNELAVRNRVAASLRQQLRSASASKPKPQASTKPVARTTASRVELKRQVTSQQRDAKSEAALIQKELHAIEQLKQNEVGQKAPSSSGKAAQLGKLELTRREQYRSLLDTSRQLSQVE